MSALEHMPSAASIIRASGLRFLSDAWPPIILIGVFLLVSSAVSAWQLAKHQHRGSSAVQDAIMGLASGNPKLPEWVTTDEIGDLARATAQAFARLKDFSMSLGASASSLGESATVLDQSNVQQNSVLARQAAALQETQVTAQEIKQTSLLASQKAEGVLRQAERAEELGRTGEDAIEQGILSLRAIQAAVLEMAATIKALDVRARQIGNITTTVKDLADQSNMLALTAATEAVRSGEHGKGFGVVARQIRNLADQSVKATGSVRDILQDIGKAIRMTVRITEQGAEKVETSVSQVQTVGDSIRQLSSIVRDNSASVRQIAAAVGQQNEGISQIFEAVTELSTMMDETMSRVRSMDDATVMVRGVAERVARLVKAYGWTSG